MDTMIKTIEKVVHELVMFDFSNYADLVLYAGLPCAIVLMIISVCRARLGIGSLIMFAVLIFVPHLSATMVVVGFIALISYCVVMVGIGIIWLIILPFDILFSRD